MATYLDQHPEVRCVASGPHYYERDQDPDVPTTVHDPEEYAELFEDAGDAERVGEKSVWYLRDPEAPEAIRADVPEADVLVQLRNPVEMVPSLHARRVERGDEPLADLQEALDVQEARRRGEAVPEGLEAPATVRYLDVARYADALRPWFDAFGRDSVHVVLHDDLEADPAGTYDEVLRFLGVEPGHRPGFDRVRPRRRVRSRRLHRLLAEPPEAAAAAARRLLPEGLRARGLRTLRRWNLDGVPDRSLDPDLRERLEEHFREEVRDLEGLLGRDLSGWIPRDGDEGRTQDRDEERGPAARGIPRPQVP